MKKIISEIPRILKRNKSSISREIKRNTDEIIEYSVEKAQEKFKIEQKHKYYFRLLKYEEFTKDFVSFNGGWSNLK